MFCSVKRVAGILLPDAAPDFHVRLTLRHAWFDRRTKQESGIETIEQSTRAGWAVPVRHIIVPRDSAEEERPVPHPVVDLSTVSFYYLHASESE
jgi:hypothetical protein